jgi:hypothetical protein
MNGKHKIRGFRPRYNLPGRDHAPRTQAISYGVPGHPAKSLPKAGLDVCIKSGDPAFGLWIAVDEIQLRLRAFRSIGNYMNRRNRLRFSTDMIATITGVEEPDISMKGRLQNLSAHGLSLIVPGELPTGITVKVEWEKSKVRGLLVYCKPYGNEYRAGLEVEDAIYDSTFSRNKAKKPAASDLKIQSK